MDIISHVHNTVFDLSHWRRLRSFGNSYLARSTYLIPVLGALLLYNQSILHLLSLFGHPPQTCEWGSCIPFWNTHSLYFGACFIAAATVIYTSRCPEIVKKYASAFEFIREEKTFLMPESMSVSHYDIVVRDDLERYNIDPTCNSLHWINNPQLTFEPDSSKIFFMTTHYDALDQCRPLARYITFSFYVLGSALLTVPAVVTFVKILLAVLARLYPHAQNLL